MGKVARMCQTNWRDWETKTMVNKKQKGFTLIEMLLVIAIIGILAGAVYAMIGDSSDAKTKSALSTMNHILLPLPVYSRQPARPQIRPYT